MNERRRRIAIPPEGFHYIPDIKDVHFGHNSVYVEKSVFVKEVKRSYVSSNGLIKQLQNKLLSDFNSNLGEKRESVNSAINEDIRAIYRSLNIDQSNSDFLEYSILHAAGYFPLEEIIKRSALHFSYDSSSHLTIALDLFPCDEKGSAQVKSFFGKAKKIPDLQINCKDGTYCFLLNYELAVGHFITTPVRVAGLLIKNKERYKNHPEFKEACEELQNDLTLFKGLKKSIPEKNLAFLSNTLRSYSSPSVTSNSMFKVATVASVVAAAGFVARAIFSPG